MEEKVGALESYGPFMIENDSVVKFVGPGAALGAAIGYVAFATARSVVAGTVVGVVASWLAWQIWEGTA